MRRGVPWLARKIRASQGTPRLINLLSHKALLCAYGSGASEVGPVHAKRAIADSPSALGRTDGATHSWWHWRGILAAPRSAGVGAGPVQ